MGVVCLAKHPFIGSRVAVKVLTPSVTPQSSLITRLFDEARAVNLVGHPGVVRVHDRGHQSDVGVYLVMELSRGHALQYRAEAGLPLVPKTVVRVVRQLADTPAVRVKPGARLGLTLLDMARCVDELQAMIRR